MKSQLCNIFVRISGIQVSFKGGARETLLCCLQKTAQGATPYDPRGGPDFRFPGAGKSQPIHGAMQSISRHWPVGSPTRPLRGAPFAA